LFCAQIESIIEPNPFRLFWKAHFHNEDMSIHSLQCEYEYCPNKMQCHGCELKHDEPYRTYRGRRQYWLNTDKVFRCKLGFELSKLIRLLQPLVRFSPFAVYLFAVLTIYFSQRLEPLRDEVTLQALASSRRVNDFGSNRVALSACIDLFLRAEVLKEEEKWYCSGCKEFQCAKKKFDFWKLPDILIVQLKRFLGHSRRKLNTLVDFPSGDEILDLRNLVKGPDADRAQYELYAVSRHMGDVGGGHYTAHARNQHGWFLFDDGYVSPVSASKSEIVDPAAYVLFYRRRGASSSESATETATAAAVPNATPSPSSSITSTNSSVPVVAPNSPALPPPFPAFLADSSPENEIIKPENLMSAVEEAVSFVAKSKAPHRRDDLLTVNRSLASSASGTQIKIKSEVPEPPVSQHVSEQWSDKNPSSIFDPPTFSAVSGVVLSTAPDSEETVVSESDD
jgi:hypothetical protein